MFRPQDNIKVSLAVKEKNSLFLSTDIGYSAYVRNPQLDRIYITPNSQLSFDLYAGDVWINFHDRFAITENSYQDPTVTGTGNYSQLQNDAGGSALWDLNKVVLRMGYDHLNYVVVSGGQGQPNAVSDLFSSSAGYTLAPEVLAGLVLGGGFIHYGATNTAAAPAGTNAAAGTSSPYPDATQWNLGAFYEAQASQYLHVRADVGYSVYTPNS